MRTRTITVAIDTLRITGLGRHEATRVAEGVRVELSRLLPTMLQTLPAGVASRQVDRERALPVKLSHRVDSTAKDLARAICEAIVRQEQRQ